MNLAHLFRRTFPTKAAIASRERAKLAHEAHLRREDARFEAARPGMYALRLEIARKRGEA